MATDRLGSYEVLDLIGRGGMGVVYLALDPRLDRHVAIKVLPISLSADAARLARFEREARTLASLSHPNLCAVYGLEEDETGRKLIVMEYIEGKTLGERLIAGPPMSMEESLDACRQIAAGLEAAHERGIIHRDLKPANVKVRPDNVVKVLDFGLAKAQKSPWGADTSDEEPTDDPHATVEGKVLGTVGYMSPEQARGKPVDRRTDIWALGCVLFECLTGGRAFRGQTPTDVAVAILEREPVWDELPDRTPTGVRTLLKRCLEKDEHRRLRDIGDARLELEDALTRARGRGHGLAMRAGKLTALPSGSHNLPEPVTSFVGREDGVRDVIAALGRARLVTLIGPAGCGKTRLAIEAAREAGVEFVDGVWLTELASVRDPDEVAESVARAVRVRAEGHRTLGETLADALRERSLLLVLDGCEAMVPAIRTLTETLLRACPGVRVLATSRSVLGCAGEASVPVGPLATPEEGRPGSASSLAAFESVQLFVDRASAVAPTFELSDDNAGSVAEVCRLVDGLPLAIELAAARVKLITPAQIAERLADRFRLIRSGRRESGGETLWTALDWSYEQLEASAQAVLRRLAVFKGGCTLPAAETAATGEGVEDWEVLDLLGQLVDRSLVMVVEQRDESRYRLLETVRQHALEKLEASGELAAQRDRHLALMVKLARQAEPQLTGKRQKAWFTRLEHEQDNIREALAWALASPERLADGVDLAGCVWRWWFYRGDTAEAHRVMRALFERSVETNASGGLALARLCTGLGWIEGEVGTPESALEVTTRGLEAAREHGDARTISNVLNTLGHIHSDIRLDADAASGAFEESLALRREVGDQVLIAGSLNNIAEVYRKRGERDKARAMYEEAITINRALDNQSWESINCENLAWLLLEEEAYDDALRYTRRGIAIDQELGAHGHQLNLIEAMASIAVARGDLELAARLFGCIEAERESRATPPSPGEIAEYQRWIDRLRERLAPDKLTAEWAAGRGMTFVQVVRHAIDMTND